MSSGEPGPGKPDALTFGKFKFLQQLGQGASGTVFKAEDATINRTVAVKVLHPSWSQNHEATERFIREARIVAKLRHPNIIQLYELAPEAQPPYLVAEYLEGGSVESRIKADPFQARDAVSVAIQMAAALSEAHRNAIVHRDLKPSNVLLEKDPGGKIARAVLCDFGLAGSNSEASGLTVTGHFYGTPGYAPPEQCRGEIDKVTARSDIFALGATLYHMLAGRGPFSAPSIPDVFDKTRSTTPPPPCNDVRLASICLKCLEKLPEDRYQSAEELIQELRRWQEGREVSARPPFLKRGIRWARKRPTAAMFIGALTLMAVFSFGVAPMIWGKRFFSLFGEKAMGVTMALLKPSSGTVDQQSLLRDLSDPYSEVRDRAVRDLTLASADVEPGLQELAGKPGDPGKLAELVLRKRELVRRLKECGEDSIAFWRVFWDMRQESPQEFEVLFEAITGGKKQLAALKRRQERSQQALAHLMNEWTYAPRNDEQIKRCAEVEREVRSSFPEVLPGLIIVLEYDMKRAFGNVDAFPFTNVYRDRIRSDHQVSAILALSWARRQATVAALAKHLDSPSFTVKQNAAQTISLLTGRKVGMGFYQVTKEDFEAMANWWEENKSSYYEDWRKKN